MKQNVWIWNHYATNTISERGGRHYSFAKNLLGRGYTPTIFCASTIHNSLDEVSTDGRAYKSIFVDEIRYIVIRIPSYQGNGASRILNMISFYHNVKKVARKLVKVEGKPDVIIASSVHPLTLVGGIQFAHQINIPCICEVRDLWPESIFVLGQLKRQSIIGKLLIRGEKWIYSNADKLIFTMEGGIDYIVSQQWDTDKLNPIKKSKVFHINNGVDLREFQANCMSNPYYDKDLTDENTFKVVYTGSIRKANNIEILLDAASYVQGVEERIRFIVFGEGHEKEALIERCKKKGIRNIVFKGYVNKKFIPSILTQSDLNILHSHNNYGIWRYGSSQNKTFEYFAAGKPILSTIKPAYDLVEKYDLGHSLESQESIVIGSEVLSMFGYTRDRIEQIKKNSVVAANEYSFENLTNRLVDIIETDVLQ